jgi:hypothetical protein
MPKPTSRKVAALIPAGLDRVDAAETPGIDSFVDAVLRVASEDVQGPPIG